MNSLQDVVKNLKQNNMISDNCALVLESTFSGVPLQLMKRLMKTGKTTKSSSSAAYHPALKAFALTLQFYSTKAYNYVRDTFGLGLPHVATITRWFGGVDGNAGFSKEVLASLTQKVANSRSAGKEILCALMIDEMAIRKHIEWDGENMVGFVDIGNDFLLG